MFSRTAVATALSLTMFSGAAVAQDFADQLAARQGQFQLFSINLGTLFTMGTGRAPYESEAAQAAADNLVKLSSLDQRALWPAGSDAGNIDGTRARPEIWDTPEDFAAKLLALNEQAVQMAAIASDGQGAVGGQVRALAGACAACHDAYRIED